LEQLVCDKYIICCKAQQIQKKSDFVKNKNFNTAIRLTSEAYLLKTLSGAAAVQKVTPNSITVSEPAPEDLSTDSTTIPTEGGENKVKKLNGRQRKALKAKLEQEQTQNEAGGDLVVVWLCFGWC
jgi:DNA-binding protein YbaB